MSERLDPKEEFERYRKENEGKPFDPEIEARARRELEVGEERDYTVLRPEASREKRIASFPQGRSSKEEDPENTEIEGRQMSTAEAIAEIEKMKEMVEGSNAEILALENAISTLNKNRESISSSGETDDKRALLNNLDRLIEEYTIRLRNLQRK